MEQELLREECWPEACHHLGDWRREDQGFRVQGLGLGFWV